MHNWDRECGSIRENQGGEWGRGGVGMGGSTGGEEGWKFVSRREGSSKAAEQNWKESKNIDGNSIRFLFFGLILLDNDLVPAASLLQAVIIDI